jgi:hypothetical protein
VATTVNVGIVWKQSLLLDGLQVKKREEGRKDEKKQGRKEGRESSTTCLN